MKRKNIALFCRRAAPRALASLCLFSALVLACQRPVGDAYSPARLPGGAPASAASGPGEAKLTVEVTALSKDGRTRNVQKGGQMRSGERMALDLYLSRSPVYVYVHLIDRMGKAQQLYPDPGQHQLLQPGPEPRRIPESPHWILLDDQTGQENFFIVANSQPMEPAVIEHLIQVQGIPLAKEPPQATPDKAPSPAAGKPRPARSAKPKRGEGDEPGGTLMRPGARRGAAVDRGMEVVLLPDAPSTIHFPFHHR